MTKLDQEAAAAFEAERQRRIEDMMRRAERAYKAALASGERRLGLIFKTACEKLFLEQNPHFFATIERLKRVPVTIDEFLESREFLGDLLDVWDALKPDIRSMNPDILCGETPVYEVVMGGATGTGKTTQARATQAYQLYLLTCISQPQRLFGLEQITPIVFMFQSVADRVTRRVIYKPFRDMFTSMPYTQRWVKWDKYTDSTLILEDRIEVVPALASVQAMVGQAIISAIMDEVNFMSVVENSKAVPGNAGQGGQYDQAEVAYRTISRRRKSRFISKGPVPGCLNVISSTRYVGDFLDRRMKEIEQNGEANTIVFRRKQYEVQPQDRYCGETFRLLVGTDAYPTRILKETDQPGINYPANATVENVPVEYLNEFKNDPESALRDVVGVATDTLRPFITQRHKIVEAIVRGRTLRLKQFVHKDNVVLSEDGMPQIVETALPFDRASPRFLHIDLAKTRDRCGIAMVRVAGWDAVSDENGVVEHLPHLVVELAVSLKPDSEKELDIAEVRKWAMQLKSFYGFNLDTVSYDGFQSTESIQMWRKAGISAMEVSMDRTSEPYDDLKRALYQDRLDMVENELARMELANLEWHEKQRKVDHPPKGSKDLADAICGACWTAARSRSIRSQAAVTTQDGEQIGNQGARRNQVRRTVNRR